MFGIKKDRFNLGAVNRDTSQIIDENIEKQQEIKKGWATRRPKTLAVSNPKPEKIEPIAVLPSKPSTIFNDDSKKGGLGTYWFPLLCIAAVISVALWQFWPSKRPTDSTTKVPDPVVNVVERKDDSTQSAKPTALVEGRRPMLDIVRVESNGSIVAAGRAGANENVSILINKKIVATIASDRNGEFSYAPATRFKPGNYTIQLVTESGKSDRVFLYVDEKPENSLSLLMTAKESRILQSPKNIARGKFTVNKIDYIANKRLVVQGKGLPKLRVSMSLDGKLMGMTRVSDHRNFGLGAGVGNLEVGRDYVLSVKMHDSNNNIVSEMKHEFEMPEMTDADDTFYVVRRGDSLWVISRNFLGKGIQFSIIATANNIENPDLIYPNQKFKIPVKAK